MSKQARKTYSISIASVVMSRVDRLANAHSKSRSRMIEIIMAQSMGFPIAESDIKAVDLEYDPTQVVVDD